jgi:hypothetical protein
MSFTRRSLCFKGELSGLFLIVHQRIPSDALVCHSLQRGISIGPSSFYMWGCSRRCLSILAAVWSVLPPKLALCPGHSVVLFFKAAGSQMAAATAAKAHTCFSWSHLDFVAVGTLFLAWTSQKGIGIVVFSALTALRSETVLL